MADVPARTELKVTTGPIRGSRKIHVEGRDGLQVAMRAVDLEPSSGEPPVVLYDTSGPYTDPARRIDIMAGLHELRRDWIRSRGDVEEVAQREVRPEDNGQLSKDEFRSVAAPRMAQMSASALQQLDKNKDGKVSPAEFNGPALAAFDRVDTNKDGTISPEERQKAPRR